MATSIAQKLRIKEGMTILTIHAPSEYKESLGPLPAGTRIVNSGKNFDQVHWFVKDRAEMEKELPAVVALVNKDVICWIFYPKRSSKMQTDLTRDKGWEKLLKEDMQWISLISFNDTWSSFGMRLKTGADKKKEAGPKARPIFDFVDPKTKTVKLPEDFASALKRNKKQEAFFNSLSFTNKKEYIEWIVTAKREETRNMRVRESIERLGKEWKNPRNQ
jgi:Bacteriocin-protection, YdeI or OmpD-Associated